MLKVSIISAVYNRCATISASINSVQMQAYPNITHVIIDGGSTDGTMNVVRELSTANQVVISEPDDGIYDALNKGIKVADGDIVGLLHSDDLFSDAMVITDIVASFSDPAVQLVYGDLVYVEESNVAKVVRRWISGKFVSRKLRAGWMPPHPTVFVRKSVFDQLGAYDTSFKISADYDAMLRFFKSGVCSSYIPRELVKMRLGGVSNRGVKNIIIKMKEDYRAIRKNNVGGVGTLVFKSLSKIRQFIT
ncbi:glycosyltransferase [Porticoccaceae bacterium]|nr:glycosyltransferase [Porticoccaceae bacterium]